MPSRLPSHAESVLVPRYKDYREAPWSSTPYELSKEFWTVLAVRLSFVIVFQVGRLEACCYCSLVLCTSYAGLKALDTSLVERGDADE